MANNPKNLHKQYYKKSNKYNVIFLPGLPGEYRMRPLIKDLCDLKCNIYSVIYPGTYNSGGTLTPTSTINAIRSSAALLLESGLPLFVVSYSYSTLFVAEALLGLENILGIMFFSPIFDLKKSITGNIKETFDRLNATKGFSVDANSFKPYSLPQANLNILCEQSVSSLRKLRTPLIYVMGEIDPVLRYKAVLSAFTAYRLKYKPNSIFLFCIPEGGHNLDTLYGHVVRRLMYGAFFSEQVARIVPGATIYAWGTTLNYRYSNEDTDVDLAIIGKDFSYKTYIRLNQLVNIFGSKHNVSMDIIVNTYAEVVTKSRIRSNRGPSFLHELKYYYTPVRRGEEFRVAQISKADIIKDVNFANNTNIYKSKKALLNYLPGSSASNWIMKHFVYACYYHQYKIGNIYVDQNNIENYYKITNPEIYSLLNKICTYKKQGYERVDLNFLKKVLEAHEKLQI